MCTNNFVELLLVRCVSIGPLSSSTTDLELLQYGSSSLTLLSKLSHARPFHLTSRASRSFTAASRSDHPSTDQRSHGISSEGFALSHPYSCSHFLHFHG